MSRPFLLQLPPGLGKPFWVAAAILACVELTLHSEFVLHRYRSVFAIGRAIDKLHYVERERPALLFLGNSRVDNGISPAAVDPWLKHAGASFNLGLPGANAVVLHGVVERLDRQRLLGDQGIGTVVLGLDEGTLQDDDSLGYAAFLASRRAQWEQGRYRSLLGSYLRLWSFSGNLRQLHEPAKALAFIGATGRSVDPVGGAAATYRGYRAGFGAAQDDAQAARQEVAAHAPPAPEVEQMLWRMMELLRQRQVRVAVVMLPLRDRESAYFSEHASAQPYRDILRRLRERGVAVMPPVRAYPPGEFVNAGHLNDQGAQRFSAELAQWLAGEGS